MSENFEESDVLKSLVFVVVLIALCAFLIFTLIMPSIREYKIAKNNNNDKIVNLDKIQQIYDARFNELNQLQTQNAKILNSFRNDFSEQKFIAYLNKFFKDIKLNRLPPTDANETFSRYELNVSTNIKDSSKIYEFLDFVNNCDNIIKVDFPVSIKSSKDQIQTKFKLSIYSDSN